MKYSMGLEIYYMSHICNLIFRQCLSVFEVSLLLKTLVF